MGLLLDKARREGGEGLSKNTRIRIIKDARSMSTGLERLKRAGVKKKTEGNKKVSRETEKEKWEDKVGEVITNHQRRGGGGLGKSKQKEKNCRKVRSLHKKIETRARREGEITEGKGRRGRKCHGDLGKTAEGVDFKFLKIQTRKGRRGICVGTKYTSKE